MNKYTEDNFDTFTKLPVELEQALTSLEKFTVKAFYIGSKILLRKMANRTASSVEPLFLMLKENGCAAVFHYGVIVFFNLKQQYEHEVIIKISEFVSKPHEIFDTESFEISVNKNQSEGVQNDIVFIKKVSLAHLELLATVLSKSVVLDYYESRVAQSFDNIEPIAKELQEKGVLKKSAKEILKVIGSHLLTQHEMAGKIGITEKPALLWEHTKLEPLYANLMEDLELVDRSTILDKKILLLRDTTETSLDMLQNRSAHRLEWYIIIIILLSLVVETISIFRKF